MGEGLAERRPETGWGEELAPLFLKNRLLVRNHAKRGRSSRTFETEGFWAKVLVEVREGDFVLVQFGHNDGSADEEQTPPEEYRTNLGRYVREVLGRRATAILATPIVVRRFHANGTLMDVHGRYPEIVRSVARSEGVELLDMQAISARLVAERGREESKALFQHLRPGEHPNYPGGLRDNIHLSPLGARLLAERAASAMRESNSSLAAFLR